MDDDASVTTSFRFTRSFNFLMERFKASFSIFGDFHQPLVYPCTPGALCTLAMHLLPLQSKSDTLLSVLESHSAHHHWLLTPEFRSVKLCLFSSTPTIHRLLEHNRTFVLARRKPWMDMRDQGICSSVLSLSGYFQITVLLKRIAGC